MYFFSSLSLTHSLTHSYAHIRTHTHWPCSPCYWLCCIVCLACFIPTSILLSNQCSHQVLFFLSCALSLTLGWRSLRSGLREYVLPTVFWTLCRVECFGQVLNLPAELQCPQDMSTALAGYCNTMPSMLCHCPSRQPWWNVYFLRIKAQVYCSHTSE